MKSVLIIGSKGFIGHHLRRFLIAKNLQVWGADVVVDYVDTNYFLIDASSADFRSIFESASFDVCINCSGAASVPDSINHPLRDFSLNTTNVFKLLDSIRSLQPHCRFINLSSAAVYGNPEKLPVAEDCSVLPMSPYGYHKLMSEQACLEFYRFFNIKTCSLRIFSAYGEGLRKQLFWDLYQKAKKGTKIQLFGTGNESRDFIYIEDLLNAIYRVALQGEFRGQAINVANGEEVFIRDCVQAFYDLFDHRIDVGFSGEVRKGDPSRWVADISELRKLGYERQYTLKRGLENYFQWIRKADSESE